MICISRKAGFMIGMECECNEANGTLIGVLFKAWKQRLKHEKWSFRRMKRRHNRSLKRPEKGEASEAMKPSHGTVWESLNFCVELCSNFVFCDFSPANLPVGCSQWLPGIRKGYFGWSSEEPPLHRPFVSGDLYLVGELRICTSCETEHPSTLVYMNYKTEKTLRCYKRFKEKCLMLIKLPPILESELRSDRGILYSISAESLVVGCKALGCLCRHHLLRTEGRRAGQAVLAVPWARKGGGEEGSDDSCPSTACANVGISLKKDCRVSWFESTELLPKRWPKIDPRRGSGTKMSKTSQTLISKNCHSKLVGNLITIRIWSKNNQSFNGNLRRDFKGDYCDLEPLDGAKQLLRTGFFPAVGDVSRVCDLSIWNHECFFKTSLGELGCLLKE